MEWTVIRPGRCLPFFPTTLWGLQLNVPIFSSGMRYQKVKQSNFALEQVKINQVATEQRLITMAEKSRTETRSAYDNFKTEERTLALAKAFSNERPSSSTPVVQPVSNSPKSMGTICWPNRTTYRNSCNCSWPVPTSARHWTSINATRPKLHVARTPPSDEEYDHLSHLRCTPYRLRCWQRHR
ncbi:MAG: TolC family protein [Flavobacteriales bacterium]|nr:TolC family protein [Flavobacteriales bacterium]